jgi:hypothetical protein
MRDIDLNEIMYGPDPRKKPYHGANVKFFYAINQNQAKSEAAGRPVFDEIPSISIQYAGMDETVRKVEPKDIQAYPEEWKAFQEGNEPVQSGLPLVEWPMVTGSVVKELQYLGFKTVEQLAAANDDVRRRLGPLGNLIKKAQDYLDAATAPQSEVVNLRESLEREKKRTAKLEEMVNLLLSRINSTEGNNMSLGKVVADSSFNEEEIDETTEAPRRGRPRKQAE